MKGLDEDECSVKPVPFTVQYIKCVFFPPLFFFTAYGFSFHNRGERSCSEDDVCARVGWALRIDQLYVFLMFPLRGHSSRRHSLPDLFFPCPPVATRSLFSFPSWSAPHFFLLIFSPFLDVFSAYIPSSSSLVLASKVPWEPCGLSAGRHTNTTAATTGTSLFSPSLSRFSSLSPFFKFFFSSSLFNVEVLSNCWLLLWFGGNGIFRRMPHAMASIHSRVPPPSEIHTHAPTHQHRWTLEMEFGTFMHKSGL